MPNKPSTPSRPRQPHIESYFDVRHDGAFKFRGSEGECWEYLKGQTHGSIHNATTNEGWSIKHTLDP